MFKRLIKISTDCKIENHWKKKLDNGITVYGCTLKRNSPAKPAK